MFAETSNVFHERNKNTMYLPEFTSLIRFGHFNCNLLALSLLVLSELHFLSLFDKLVLVFSELCIVVRDLKWMLGQKCASQRVFHSLKKKMFCTVVQYFLKTELSSDSWGK